MNLIFLSRADPKAFNCSGQNALDVASFCNQNVALKLLSDFLKPQMKPQMELVNFFSHSVVDRQSYKRTDEDSIRAVMKTDKAKFVVFGDLRLLISSCTPSKSGCQILYLSWNEIEKVIVTLSESDWNIIFLGVGDVEQGILIRETNDATSDKFAYFAINFKQVNNWAFCNSRMKRNQWRNITN